MGIEGLTSILKTKGIRYKKHIELDELRNSSIAIDMSSFIIKIFTQNMSSIITKYDIREGEDICKYIEEMFLICLSKIIEFHITSMDEYCIIPYYIFENRNEKIKELKRNERDKRDRNTNKNNRIISEFCSMKMSDDVYDSYCCMLSMRKDKPEVDELNDYTQRELKRSLNSCLPRMRFINRLMGAMRTLSIPNVLTFNCEGEKACCILVDNGTCEYIYTNDTDTMVMGCKNIICNLNYPYNPLMYDVDAVLDGLELTIEQFKDFAIMCGCDFNKRVKGVGPVKALNLIKRFGSIDNIPTSEYLMVIINNRKYKVYYEDDDFNEVYKYKLCRQLLSTNLLPFEGTMNIDPSEFHSDIELYEDSIFDIERVNDTNILMKRLKKFLDDRIKYFNDSYEEYFECLLF